MPQKLTERDIAKTCSDFLELDGWRPIKMEPISRREWGKGTGEKGQADYLYVRYKAICKDHPDKMVAMKKGVLCGYPWVELLWIEWKSAKGKPKPHQLDWHRAERARGALTWIAGVDFPASIEGFMDHYRHSGLLRRTGL